MDSITSLQIKPSNYGILWRALSIATLVGTLGIAGALLFIPEIGLPLFWGVIVPILPAVFLFAPGIWRNICPMAFLNQLPREYKFTREMKLSPAIAKYSFSISCFLLLFLVSARKWLFDKSGIATVGLAVFGLAMAFTGGLLFKGMSGWCSVFCPILPVEKLYGQARFLKVETAYCRPCIRCTKNCYNAMPDTAAFLEQNDPDKSYAGQYRFFAGVFPGFVLAFFNTSASMGLAIS